MGALVDAFIRLAEITAALAVPEDTVVDADLVQHTRRNLTRECAVVFPMHILCADMDIRSLDRLCNGGQRRSRRAYHNVCLRILDQRSQSLDQLNALFDRIVHLPVAGNNRSSSHSVKSSLS